ncbi:DeoR/GlpR family DNA-binding transcription regulator [Aquamicrobium segne]|uniref:DeoR/GlpR family DNA-binding transcription regulator n=1 Tax=Aquamicrobium segne TaxID=469547 RepID=A0ABW0GT97_9HYPH
MLPALRRARIIELLRRDGAAGLKEMSEAVGVSVSTLRRDVDYLCEQGHLERTHGGAVLNEGRRGIELDREIASELESDAKSAIGSRAAALIQPGQTVFLDSGTTTSAAARAARQRNIRFTAVTNDFTIAGILSDSPIIQVLVASGTVRPGTSTLLGADTVQYIRRLRTDLALVGTHALSEEEMSDTSLELGELKRTIISASDRPVLLADSSKIFDRAFYSFGQVSDVHHLITDTRLAAEKQAILGRNGMQVDIAPDMREPA